MVPGVVIEVGREAVWVRSAEPLAVVSSAFVGGALRATRHILNVHWPGDGASDGLDTEVEAFARRLGIREPFVGLATAAATDAAAVATEALGDLAVTAVVTAGLGAVVSAGLSPPAPWRPSTINIVVVLDADLEPAAAVNGVATATEAKVAALGEAGVVTPDGWPATGTVTDAVVIAWTRRGPGVRFLGPAAP
ncbi:MAG: adenosylcobinamide amidohydrolase, partial [Candidatus Rokuibacteriota bacterium]